MSEPKLTREDWIYLWKTEGGNMSWRRWCAVNEIPESNPGWLEEIKKEIASSAKSTIIRQGNKGKQQER